MRFYALVAYYFTYFISLGLYAFMPKYYGEIGLSDSRIGILTSVPTLVALALTPALGALSDSVSRKRRLLAAWLILAAGSCFAAALAGPFFALLLAVTGYTVFATVASPIATTISLEHCSEIGRHFGPIRLMGTVGYQVGALLVGAVLSASLKNLYPMIGMFVLCAAALTLLMPNVAGHQHHQKKVPLKKLFADRHICMLYGLILYATISSQFHVSFFSKHLGDLGMSNTVVSLITVLSVMLELPFLFFGDRIARKTNVWNFILIGMAANGVRSLGLAFTESAPLIVLFQLPGVTVLACYEFIPALYLNRRVSPEQLGSAQSLLTLTSFGAGKIIGSLLGGFVCERTGIPAVFAFNGVMLLVGCLIFWKPTRRLIRGEAS